MSFANKTLNRSQINAVPYVANRQVTISSSVMPSLGYTTAVGKLDGTPLNSLSTHSIHYQAIGGLFYNQQAYSQSVVKPISQMTFDELRDYQEATSSLLVKNYYYDILESTAAEGTLDATLKVFSTASNSEIVTLSIPQNAFGEKVREGSFAIGAANNSYYIVDDSNGNLIDIVPYLVSEYGVGGYELGTYTGSLLSTTNLLYEVINYSLSGSNTGSVGNIFYAQGIAVITNNNYTSSLSTAYTVKYKSTQTIYQQEVICQVSENDYNYTLNPTIVTTSSGSVRDFVTGSSFQPYVTTVGLYNETNELLVVAKLAQPFQIPANTDVNFTVRYDF